jgi:hypothetical protein
VQGYYCYWCGSTNPGTRDHIPGQLFGVKGIDRGVVVPSCHRCNHSWELDQEFFRLRLVLHAGSSQALKYSRDRELRRLTHEKHHRGTGRYLEECSKLTCIEGKDYYTLTKSDCERIKNVVMHWAAALHYSKTACLATVPGVYLDTHGGPKRLSVRKLREKLKIDPSGFWSTDAGEFARYWFLPGRSVHNSSIVFNVLGLGTLWFFVKFDLKNIF